MKKTIKSQKLFEQANTLIPGGVNSPVRAFKNVGGTPLFIQKAQGAYIYDEDANRYIDYVSSWGTAIIGHAHPEVIESLKTAMDRGTSYGAPTGLEVELARLITEAFSGSIEKVRFVSSGTEACMTAVRLARGFTGRDLILKFDGHYHGHSDALLAHAGSGVATFEIESAPGIPKAVQSQTLSIPFNDFELITQVFETRGAEIACVMMEPIGGNCGFLRPEPGFLQHVRELCTKHGVLMILDEVITGFRVRYGGAQHIYDVKPDLTILGKIIGGGLPLAALGGRADIMDYLAPVGKVYQAGTLSGNPLATQAGITTLEILKRDHVHAKLNEMSSKLVQGIEVIAKRHNESIQLDSEGGMFSSFVFSAHKIKNEEDMKRVNKDKFNRFFHLMLENGIYLAPSAFEIGFLSAAHTSEHVDQTLSVVDQVLSTLHEPKN